VPRLKLDRSAHSPSLRYSSHNREWLCTKGRLTPGGIPQSRAFRFESVGANVPPFPVRPCAEPSRLPHAKPVGQPVRQLRISLVGFGTVGQWLVRALDSQAERLAGRYGIGVTVVGLANARDGFIYDGNGLDLRSVLALADLGSITEHQGVRCWPSTIEGLRATEADLLVEVTASPSNDGEPGLTHMREALERRIPVVTSNKWPRRPARARTRQTGTQPRGRLSRRIHCHVGNALTQRVGRWSGRRGPDRASGPPQCKRQLHPLADGLRHPV
jgi:hypothetical protein